MNKKVICSLLLHEESNYSCNLVCSLHKCHIVPLPSMAQYQLSSSTTWCVAYRSTTWYRCQAWLNTSSVPLQLGVLLTEVPHGTVAKHGSIPAQFLYNWVFVCVSLIEHSRKMRAGRPRVITDEIAARKRNQMMEDLATAELVEDVDKKEVPNLFSFSLCDESFTFTL